MNFLIELGSKVKSNINGFTGMAVSRSEHLNGCNRYWVCPPMDKDGKVNEGYWVDESELIVLAKPKLKRTNPDRGGFQSKIK